MRQVDKHSYTPVARETDRETNQDVGRQTYCRGQDGPDQLTQGSRLLIQKQKCLVKIRRQAERKSDREKEGQTGR